MIDSILKKFNPDYRESSGRTGEWKEYYQDSSLKKVENFLQGKPHGF